jgi:LPS-assembly protein
MQLRKGDQSIRMDRLRYFQDTRDIDAQGSVVVEQEGSTMSGPHLRLNLDTSIGTMEQPEFFLKENDGRGSAEVMHILDKQRFTLEKASYTTCPADNQDWMLKVGELEIDRGRQIGTAHHAPVNLRLPILYSPMDFPLNDQRKSGFLSPIFRQHNQGRQGIDLPYYWNIAPNRDATIAPRVITKRGVLLNNEFRYLEPNYAGELHLDVMSDDKLAKRSRTHMSMQHTQTITGGLSGCKSEQRIGQRVLP